MMVKPKPGFPDTPYRIIRLANWGFTLVDFAIYDELNRYQWYAKKSFHCWYVCRRTVIFGQSVTLRLHRIVAKTPDNMVCHHINKKTFDNRLDNLQNLFPYEHKVAHSWR